MRTITKLLLAGAGAVSLAGAATAAERAHVMRVSLPDGQVAEVHYSGKIAPRVVALPVAADPFADMDRMFAAMAAQHDAVMRQVAMEMQQAAARPKLTATSRHAVPSGSSYSYTYVSTAGGKNGCVQSYRATSYGDAAPRVEEQRSGDCAGVPVMTPTGFAPAPAAPPPPPASAPARTPAAKAPDRYTV